MHKLNLVKDFITFDINLAAYLVYMGYAVDYDRTNPSKVAFVFKRGEGLEQEAENYWQRKARIEPNQYTDTFTILLNVVRSGGKQNYKNYEE